jgi:hypothetical protein
MNQNPAISDDPLPEGEQVAQAKADAPVRLLPQTQIHTDPHTLAAVSSGELHDPQLLRAPGSELDDPDMRTMDQTMLADASRVLVNTPEDSFDTGVVVASKNQALNAQLAQVGLTNSDTWNEEIKPRIENLQGQILEINDRLDHLTTRKYR